MIKPTTKISTYKKFTKQEWDIVAVHGEGRKPPTRGQRFEITTTIFLLSKTAGKRKMAMNGAAPSMAFWKEKRRERKKDSQLAKDRQQDYEVFEWSLSFWVVRRKSRALTIRNGFKTF